jgi:hypothetical protein
MVLRYAHPAPHAGNRSLAKPRDAEVDPAQDRMQDVRFADDEEDETV